MKVQVHPLPARERAGRLRVSRLGAALLGAQLFLSGCATLREAFQPPPQGAPSGRDGWLVYTVGAMRLEAPAGWTPSGTSRHLALAAPDGAARLEVSTPDAPFPTPQACLAAAEDVMKRGDALERVRRHPTTFAGARALTLEGDQGGWHVWAWAACDGATQYQVFFTAKTPAPAPVLEAHRTLVSSARIGGQV
jgi:hypothetical protein